MNQAMKASRQQLSKPEKSWILYDWANSAYSIAVTTAFLPIFFKTSASAAGVAESTSTAIWGYATSISFLTVSVLAPILGTLADYKGFKKRFFLFFFGIGVVFTAMLAAAPVGAWKLLLGFYIVSVIGFAGANIFYDAFLVDVADGPRMHKISSLGFGFGYIGSTIPFIISIALVFFCKNLGIEESTAYRGAFAITAVWWGLFTIPMIRNVSQMYGIEHDKQPIAASLKRIWGTLMNIKNEKPVFLFLLAYFFYIDGVDTIINMSGVYATEIGVSAINLLVILLATQLVAFPFALLYGKLAEKLGARKLIMAAIIIYIGICIFAFFMRTVAQFWILAMLVASSQGGIQALSRSYFGRLVPKEKSTEYFGFYNIFGKFASIIGPALMATVAIITGNSRYGVLSIVALFVLGLAILVVGRNSLEKQNV